MSKLSDRLRTKIRSQRFFGVPIMIGFSGDRNPGCKFFSIHRRYGTEYCNNPEHIKRFTALLGGRGIIKGCVTCPLNGGKGTEFE